MNKNNQLQLSLFSNFSNLITVRLDDSNYVTWRFLLEKMLVGCDLMGYIDGSVPCPSQYELTPEAGITPKVTQEFQDWWKNDSALITLLASTLSSDALSFIVGSKTSKEVWFSLEERYGKLSKYKAFELKISIQQIQKGNDSIDKYMERIKTVRDRLAVAGVYISDEDIIDSVLHGLPSEYATMKTIIRIKTLTSSVSMEELRSLLLIAEDEIEETVKSIFKRSKTKFVAHGDSQRRYAPAPTLVTNAKYDANAMMPTNSVASSIGYTEQSMSNLGCIMSDGPNAPTAVSNGMYHATASTPKMGFMYAANTVFNNESQGDFVLQFSSPSQSAASPAPRPLYMTNASSPSTFTRGLATYGGMSQVHNACFPQTSSFLQQPSLSHISAPYSSTTQHNVYGCFSQPTGFIAQSEGMQQYYGNAISNGAQSCNGPQQLQGNSQSLKNGFSQQNDKNEASNSVEDTLATALRVLTLDKEDLIEEPAATILVSESPDASMCDDVKLAICVSNKDKSPQESADNLNFDSIVTESEIVTNVTSHEDKFHGILLETDFGERVGFGALEDIDLQTLDVGYEPDLFGEENEGIMEQLEQVSGQDLAANDSEKPNTLDKFWEHQGLIEQLEMDLKKVRVMMSCRKACQPLELWPSLPLLPPG